MQKEYEFGDDFHDEELGIGKVITVGLGGVWVAFEGESKMYWYSDDELNPNPCDVKLSKIKQIVEDGLQSESPGDLLDALERIAAVTSES